VAGASEQLRTAFLVVRRTLAVEEQAQPAFMTQRPSSFAHAGRDSIIPDVSASGEVNDDLGTYKNYASIHGFSADRAYPRTK
jgi:hypothetical protein